MTTDLFLAAAGLDALALIRAVPPACLRGVDPAPITARDGSDALLMLPTWTPRRPAVHLLPSFAPLTDAPLAFRFEVSALADGEWSLSAADDAPPDLRLPDGVAARLDVPALSQLEADAALGPRICSPTSVAMVLGYWGRAAAPSALAAEVFHPALDIYGVWPAAVRAAAARGIAGYLLRFPDWSAARWCLERGIPIVASIRYVAGELTHAAIAATPGHLLVLVGLDGDAVLVNDPAAPTAASVPRRYRADEFGKVWLARGGVGYVLFDPARL